MVQSKAMHIKSKLFYLLNKRISDKMYKKLHNSIIKDINNFEGGVRDFFIKYAITDSNKPLYNNKLGNIFLMFFEKNDMKLPINSSHSDLIVSIVSYLDVIFQEKNEKNIKISYKICKFIFLIIIKDFYNSDKSKLPSKVLINKFIKEKLEKFKS